MVGRFRDSRTRVLPLALLAAVIYGSCGGHSEEREDSPGDGSGGTSDEGGAGNGAEATGGTDAGEGGTANPGGRAGRGGEAGRGGASNGGATAGDAGDAGEGGIGGAGGGGVLPPALFDTKELAIGEGQACALLTDGEVRCWGRNAIVVDVDEYSYTERGYLDAPRGPFSHLAASEQRTCGATATSLECWSDESGSMAYSSIADLDGAPRGGGLVLLGDGAVHDWQGSLVSGQAAALGAGSSLSCALDPSGYAHCWPAAVIPEDEFRELTGGGDYMCGLRTNGTVLCWNRQGPDAGVEPPKGEFETISSGHSHVCGLRPDKTIECWGGSKFGDIRPPTGTFVDVEAGAHTTCAIREQGGVTCWGDDSLFQASPPADISSENRGFTRISTGGSAVNVGGTQTDDTVDPPYEWLVPSPGHATACALRVDGSFDCFGHAETLVPRDRKFRALAADGRAICGVTSDGLECWGDSTSPLDGTAHEGDFVDVSIAWGVVCVLDGAGKIACFGPRSLALPANVEDGTFLQVSAGGTDGSSRDLAVCALHDDQSVTCWGYDINLELGTRHSPAGSFDHISTGYYYACGTLTDGTASCWDREGGTVEAIEGTFTRVLAGIQQNCGLRSNGSVSCWTTRYGNLDLVEIVALRGDYAGRFVDLSMGGDYVCGILEEGGGIKCWGARGR